MKILNMVSLKYIDLIKKIVNNVYNIIIGILFCNVRKNKDK